VNWLVNLQRVGELLEVRSEPARITVAGVGVRIDDRHFGQCVGERVEPRLEEVVGLHRSISSLCQSFLTPAHPAAAAPGLCADHGCATPSYRFDVPKESRTRHATRTGSHERRTAARGVCSGRTSRRAPGLVPQPTRVGGRRSRERLRESHAQLRWSRGDRADCRDGKDPTSVGGLGAAGDRFGVVGCDRVPEIGNRGRLVDVDDA
jgi:hypothetical protein